MVNILNPWPQPGITHNLMTQTRALKNPARRQGFQEVLYFGSVY